VRGNYDRLTVRPLRLFAVVAPAVLLAGVLSGCGSVSPNAATINGSAVTRSALNGELSDISASPRYIAALQSQGGQVAGSGPGTYTQGFVASILNARLIYLLIHDDLVRRKALPDGADISAAAQAAPQQQQYNDQSGSFFSQFPASYRNTLTKRLADVQKLEGLVGTDSADQQYYDTHTAEFATEVCVRHILLAAKDLDGSVDFAVSKTEADQEKAKLDGGADFATLAKADSQDNAAGGSAANGGALQGSAPDKCLSAQDVSNLVTPFQQAVVELPLNQVSDPVQTQFGYHLIEVTSRVVAPLDQAKADVTGQVFNGYLQKELAASSMKVDPQYGSVQKPNADNGNVPTIIPPTGPVFAGSTTTTVAPAATASQ
jgi:parvulin-like peptidyl-prolyl isomerase